MCHGVHMAVRGQLGGVSFPLSPCGYWNLPQVIRLCLYLLNQLDSPNLNKTKQTLYVFILLVCVHVCGWCLCHTVGVWR